MNKTLSVFFIACLAFFITASQCGARGGFRAGGGGPTFGWFNPDLGPLNREIEKMGLKKIDGGFLSYGGRGFGYISKNIRIGGGGAGGGVCTNGYTPSTVVSDTVRISADSIVVYDKTIPAMVKEVCFSMGYGGVTLEYTFDVPFDIQFFAGGMLGWGGVSISMSQNESSLSWNGLWDGFQTGYTGDSYDLTVTADNGIFILDPWVGAEFKVFPWMGFYTKAGYFYAKAKSDNWEVNGSRLFNAPDLDLGSFHFEFAIIFGG